MDNLSHKTAISRNKLSRPAQFFRPYLEGKVLDFGCGKGDDAGFLGIDKYDQHYFPEKPADDYDTVMMIYVLNTVEFPRVVVREALDCLKPGGLILIACRTIKEVKKNATLWTPQGRGWITSRGTFQRGVHQDEIVSLLPKFEVVKKGGGKFSYVIARR